LEEVEVGAVIEKDFADVTRSRRVAKLNFIRNGMICCKPIDF
jgi:hypothetical protein